MGEVIAIAKLEPRIWVCNCGCSTFELRDNGEAACAACQALADVDGSGWASWDAQSNHDESTAFTDVQGNGSVDFARRRVADMAKSDDAALLLVVRKDGGFSLWSEAETVEQVAWAKRKFRAAAALLKRKV
jgi:hypothetical protein